MAGRVSRWFKHQMGGGAKWPLRSLPTLSFYDSNFKNLSHFLRSPEEISQSSLVTHRLFNNTKHSPSSYLCLDLEVFLKCNFSPYVFIMISPLAEVLSRNCDDTDEHSTSVIISLSNVLDMQRIVFIYILTISHG